MSKNELVTSQLGNEATVDKNTSLLWKWVWSESCFWCRRAALTSSFGLWLSCVAWWGIVAFNIWDLRDNLGNEINSSEDAWVTANCAYLVVIVISVTRPDVLLSCEAAVGKQISYINGAFMMSVYVSGSVAVKITFLLIWTWSFLD